MLESPYLPSDKARGLRAKDAFGVDNAKWRATVPYSDADIDEGVRVWLHRQGVLDVDTAAELRDWARSRILNRWVLGLALPWLTRTCRVCGRRALYQVDYRGYCAEHRP